MTHRAHRRDVPAGEVPWTTCQHTGKRRYTSRKKAKQAAAVAQQRDLTAYECSSCEGWHLGHLPKMVRDGDAVRWDMQPRVD